MSLFSLRRARAGGVAAAAVLLTGVALGAPTASAASAAPLPTVVMEVCDDTGDVGTELNATNATLNIAKFDPAIGILNSATLTVFYSGTSQVTLINPWPTPQTVRRVSSTQDWSFTFGEGDPIPANHLVLHDTQGGSLGQNETLVLGPTTTSDSLDFIAPDVTPFVGTGTYPVVANTGTGLSVLGGGGNLSVYQVVSGRVKVCIAYDYTIRAGASMSVEKSVSPTTVPAAGGNVTYTYTVRNTGGEPATIAAVGDDKLTLPAVETCKVGTVLPAGGSCSFTVTTTLPAGAGGSTLTNTFSVTPSNGFTTSAPVTATATVTYLKPPRPKPTHDVHPTRPSDSPDKPDDGHQPPASDPAPVAAAPAGQTLPATGTDAAPLAIAGVSALVIGGLLVFGVRRRRPDSH